MNLNRGFNKGFTFLQFCKFRKLLSGHYSFGTQDVGLVALYCFLITKHKTAKSKWETRIFSGIQPTGSVHLGNYFGAIQKWVSLQNEDNDVIYCIADLHSVTRPQDPKSLRSNILLMAASLIACGIDPSKSILFQQSKVYQHTALCWVLSCLTTMPRLGQLPQYKEKSATLKEIPLGLFIYPVLQAADILLYKTTHVPVGDDQVQQLQLAQHLARLFNNKFGEMFPSPRTIVSCGASSRVKNLRDPMSKMSKSHADPRSRIVLTDPPDVIVEKLKKAVTDFTSAVTYDPETRPGVSNLIALHSLVTGRSYQAICAENSQIDTGRYKLVVADAIINHLAPITKEISCLLNAPDYLEEVLDQGSQRATLLAEITWSEVQRRVGFDVSVIARKSDLSQINL